jgi:hypothetical protein
MAAAGASHCYDRQRERERIDAHFEIRKACRRYLDQMRTPIRVVGTLNEEDLDPAATDQLLQLFREWNRTWRSSGIAPSHGYRVSRLVPRRR